MDDYGLSALSDDQLIELMRQNFAELCQRDPVIWHLANEAVVKEAERFKAAVEACKDSIRKAKADLAKEFREESYKELRAMYAAGEVNLLTPEEEAKLVAETTAEAYIKLIDEEELRLKSGGGAVRFFFEIDGSEVLVSAGNGTVRAKTPLATSDVQQVLGNIRQLLAV